MTEKKQIQLSCYVS